MSGGYEDDEDYGVEIVYTGHGGNDPATGRQIADQTLESSGNRALAHNTLSGHPVRVIRGMSGDPQYSPASGFRYDGFFRVDDHWEETGRAGFKVIRFTLTKLAAAEVAAFEEPAPVSDAPAGDAKPKRSQTTTTRIVRDSTLTRWVKRRHGHSCQFCGTTLDTPVGPYAEGTHIKPLGKPHNGPDVVANILCLCPNHHVLFDAGAVGVNEDGSLIGAPGNLNKARGHQPNPAMLAYHRTTHGLDGV